MDDEDDIFLKNLNRKYKDATANCSVLDFEQVMYAFETTATEKQPFAAVDGTPVLTFEELDSGIDEWIEEDRARTFAKEIYPHWKTRRAQTNNQPLTIPLKAETGVDTDDADPYVCFRRRELRQTRKTRGRDAHSAEKLKKLRKELEEARELMMLIKQRENVKKDQLTIERQLFEQRASLRQVKHNLPSQYKQGDEDLLINQKKKKVDPRQPGQPLRLPQAVGGRVTDDQLVSLHEMLEQHQKDLQYQIEMKIAAHTKWNEGWVDRTTGPLTPPLEIGTGSTFRTATTEYLPTPPASISSEQSGDFAVDATSVRGELNRQDESIAVRYASPLYDGPTHSQPSFRRRYGRGGRLWIDRRGRRNSSRDDTEDTAAFKRFQFDEDDDEDEVPTYPFDPFSSDSLRFRASLLKMPPQLRRNHEGEMLLARQQHHQALQAQQNHLSGASAG